MYFWSSKKAEHTCSDWHYVTLQLLVCRNSATAVHRKQCADSSLQRIRKRTGRPRTRTFPNSWIVHLNVIRTDKQLHGSKQRRRIFKNWISLDLGLHSELRICAHTGLRKKHLSCCFNRCCHVMSQAYLLYVDLCQISIVSSFGNSSCARWRDV